MNDRDLYNGFKEIVKRNLPKMLVSYNLDSYNKFVLEGVQKIIDEIGIIPLDENKKLLLWKVEFGGPILKEADGYDREITPMEARIRDLNYTCALYINVVPVVNDVHQEPAKIKLCDFPIMLKSVLDPTRNLNKEDLIKIGEDPYDPGGYFIINGTEKIIVGVEEVANNRMVITREEKKNIEMARINSEKNQYIQRHMIERKDRILYMNFSNLRNVPMIVVLRALGLETDKQLIEAISDNQRMEEEVLTNIYEFEEVKTKKDALTYLERFVKGMGKETPQERVQNLLNNFLLHHIGTEEKDQIVKANYLSHVANRLIKVGLGMQKGEDIDHLANKRIRLAGYFLDILLRSLLLGKNGLSSRIRYNYQRLTKRKKTPAIQALFESNYVSKRIISALATGMWVGGRVGVAQRLDRINYVRRLSNMRAVISTLSSSQEHLEARELHGTHWGKYCAQETPEGVHIGLRKHLANMVTISKGLNDKENKKVLDFIANKL
ncbi:MAG TPA: DNA-directed RNA polymerase subunit B'' [Candidatus Aenigmarchaeota archaeon]|nr:MAG: DNA-directed RNA polymerase subunit B'' [Candidatus Aenigmarchaeota archaeon]HDI06537.1 DNA-directed RNA polymerase subunit B'' [Candidatus Aenigmarchaeota archaeon]